MVRNTPDDPNSKKVPELPRQKVCCYPSPCCGKESEYVDNYTRRCPCGKTWRT